jgi:APA family basic amino acid/polyamine antiporter
MSLFIKKPLKQLLEEASDSEKGLKKTLGAGSLIALGIGAIIGAGLFVRTAAAAAEHAGPSVTIGFIIAAIGCAFAGLCYAEFSSSIPIAGSAYTYSYATMGEFMAWIIGWDLILEYAVGGATVGIAWSEYLNNLLVNVLHTNPVPFQWCHSPFEKLYQVIGDQNIAQFGVDLAAKAKAGVLTLSRDEMKDMPANLQSLITVTSGYINFPALSIIFLLSLLLIKGTQESAMVNSIIVVTKVIIVIMIIVIGWQFINPTNHAQYIPESANYVDSHGISKHFGGFWGIVGSAGVVFFAFIGFDAVSTAAQEAKNPKRDMPIGILGSLAICTVLYILFAHVLTGVATTEDFRSGGKEASVAFAINKYMIGYKWLANLVTVAILAGFSSVILVLLMGQSRVFYSMSRDGLLPAMLSDVHPKFKTPYKANWAIFLIVGFFAAFLPGDIVGDMSSIGTLFAFILVCIGVIILRKTDPDMPRQFKTPLVPLVPILGVLFCTLMIAGLGWTNWLRLLVWLLLGFIIYFGYSKKHSKLRNNQNKE